MLRRICTLIYAGVLLVTSCELLAQETSAMELARRYVSLRPSILNFTESAGSVKTEDIKIALSVISSEILRKYGQEPNWNASNPEWNRLKQIIEADIEQAIQLMVHDPSVIEIRKKAAETFLRGLISHLSEAELNNLVQVYSSPEGKELASIQQQMFNEFEPTISKRQKQILTGEKAKEDEIPLDQSEFKQLLGLFDELVRVQWALLDPGPKGDRSGLQVIPIMAMIAIKANYARYSNLWRDIPEQDRRSILSWRDSTEGRKERDAIYEAAKDVKTLIDAEGQAKKVADKFAALENRWRLLIQSRKQE